jgi:hypothetical protein
MAVPETQKTAVALKNKYFVLWIFALMEARETQKTAVALKNKYFVLWICALMEAQETQRIVAAQKLSQYSAQQICAQMEA